MIIVHNFPALPAGFTDYVLWPVPIQN